MKAICLAGDGALGRLAAAAEDLARVIGRFDEGRGGAGAKATSCSMRRD